MKKAHIKTYGCQMNVYDSTRMADLLAPMGYSAGEDYENADLVILNTCHIREKAEEKVYSDLGRVRMEKERLATEGKKMLIAVAGCVAQAEGEEIIRRAPFVDMVFGPQSYHRLPDMLARAMHGQEVVDLDFAAVEKFDALPETTLSQSKAAFLSIQEGCDKFCTFCVVPYTRGAEISRPVEAVLNEARRMAAQGVMEITLLGQNVNAYHGQAEGDEWGLGKLIRELAKIDGIQRIRYTTSHPRDMDDALIAAHAEVEQLMPFLHLPIQSGSDRILQKMNRKHKAAEYLAIIEKLRKAQPEMALSSDFIVGFPGETEEDFEATLRLVETVGYAQAYSFKYSPRPGTPAATAEDQVPEEVKESRLAKLQALLVRQQIAFNKSCVGKEMDILLDRPGKLTHQWMGRSPYMQSVHVRDAEAYKEQMVRVRITEGFQNSLAGEIIQPARQAA